MIYWVFCFLLNRSQTYTVIRSSTKYTEIIIQNSKTPTNPRKSQKITIHQKQPETTSETTTKPTRNPDTTCFYPNPSDTYAKYGGVGCIWIIIMGVSDGGGTSTAKDDLLSGNDVYDGYDRYDNLYDEQFDSQYDNANDDIPMDVLIPLLISLWGLMSLCLCIYTHKFIWRSPAVSKLCMYVVLCSLVMFFATIIAFKPAHENDGWYYGPDSNWRRFNRRSYERWRRDNGDVELTWGAYKG